MQDIWGKVQLTEGEVHYFKIGDLHLWGTYSNQEVWLASAYSSELSNNFSEEHPPDDVSWSRWATRNNANKIEIQPVFPDLSLVVNSEYALKVSPDTQIQIFARIPIWIRISTAENDYKLTELPTVLLSRTWFGTFTEGELCYHATTKARRTLSGIDKKPYLVSCPITISNKSATVLDFEYFCFRVERLGMYQYEGEFWADETKIIFHGEDSNSDVIMTGKLPPGIKSEQAVAKPRQKIQKSLATRTFKRLIEDTFTLS